MNRSKRRRGGVAAGVLITLAVLFGLLVGAAVVGGLYIAHNTRVEETHSASGKSVEVTTPLGSVRVHESGRLDPVKAGIPVYPGAASEQGDSQSVSVELDLGSLHQEVTVTAAHYSTEDSVDKVVEFYKKELPHWIIARKRRSGVRMEYTERGYKRFIGVSEKHGRTHMVLAQVGEPPAI